MKTFSRHQSVQVRARIARGFTFPLPATTRLLGGDPENPEDLLIARVQKLTLAKLAMMPSLSPRMQGAVLAVFEEMDRTSRDTSLVQLRDPWATFQSNVHAQADLVDGVCVAGFLAPRLTETEEDAAAANDPNVVWVEEIAEEDRAAYLDLVMRPESEAAKQMAPFPDNGVEDPAGGRAVPPARAAKSPVTVARGDGLR